jgi:hypothetical protein
MNSVVCLDGVQLEDSKRTQFHAVSIEICVCEGSATSTRYLRRVGQSGESATWLPLQFTQRKCEHGTEASAPWQC